MGQAKQRGTFEQRRDSAIARNTQNRIRNQAELDAAGDKAHPPAIVGGGPGWPQSRGLQILPSEAEQRLDPLSRNAIGYMT